MQVIDLPLIPTGRKSSKEDPAVSRDRQSRVTSEWGERTGTPLADFVWEGGVSGNKDWRERGIGLALEACRRGEAAGIVVEDQTRLSRQNGLATAELWEVFQTEGFRLVCIADGLDTDNGDQELNFTMRAAFAREQWKQYARRMAHAKKNAVERGVHISGKVPFGYRRLDVGLPLTVERAERTIVRRAFKMYAAGNTTLGEVQRYLIGATDHPWSTTRLKKMLQNRVYLGEARQGELVNPKGHTAIVEQGIFDVVQAKLEKTAQPGRGRQDAKHLLAGLCRCAGCGYGMQRTRSAGRYFVYRCADRTKSCSAPTSIMAEALEEYISGEWRERVAAAEELDPIPLVDAWVKEREQILAELEVTRQNNAVYLDPKVAGTLGPARLATAVANGDAEERRLMDALAEHVAKNGGGQENLPDPAVLLRLFDEGTTNEQRELLAGSIEAIAISRAPLGTSVAKRTHIHWVGDGTAPDRPARGRPRKEVEAGVTPAK